MAIALIDGDIVVFRCAASCEPNKSKPWRDPVDIAISRADELLYRICNTLAVEEYRVFIGGSENFRKALDPNYKANRVQPKPEHFHAVRELLLEEWEAKVSAGREVDDDIGIAANSETIICTIDKDLRQVPGRHYNFVKDVVFEVDEQDAVRSFYSQMLTGDSSDNVKGIDGVGPVRAGRILDGLGPEDMEATVRHCYREAGRSHEEFLRNVHLLRILRSEEEYQEIEAFLRQSEGTCPPEGSRFFGLKATPGVDSQ